MHIGFRAALVATLILPALAASQTLPATRPAINRPINRPIPALDPKLPTLWIIGDSTVRNGQDRGENGQWGWGNPIRSFFDRTRINVVNYALGGTSSRSYQTPSRVQKYSEWDMVLNNMKPGDFVIMQFGHNDGGNPADPSRARASLPGNGEETKEIDNPITGRHEVVHTFGWYMRKYVTDAKAKGAVECIICSLIPRNHWLNGKMDSTQKYPQWAQDAAKESGAEFIDLHTLVATQYEAMGQQKTTDVYFPVGETTHPDWAGAILNAHTVVAAIKSLDHSALANYLLPTPPTDFPLPSGKAR